MIFLLWKVAYRYCCCFKYRNASAYIIAHTHDYKGHASASKAVSPLKPTPEPIRNGGRPNTRSRTAVLPMTARLRSKGNLTVATPGSHKAILVKITCWSVDLSDLIGGCPMGAAGDPTTSSLTLTLAWAPAADEWVVDPYKALGSSHIIYYCPISAFPDPSQLWTPQASGRE